MGGYLEVSSSFVTEGLGGSKFLHIIELTLANNSVLNFLLAKLLNYFVAQNLQFSAGEQL